MNTLVHKSPVVPYCNTSTDFNSTLSLSANRIDKSLERGEREADKSSAGVKPLFRLQNREEDQSSLAT